MEFFLHADKHESFYKLALPFLMEVARHIQSIENRKLAIFLQYLKTKVPQLLLCSVVIQDIKIFYRVPVMFIVTCFLRILKMMKQAFLQVLEVKIFFSGQPGYVCVGNWKTCLSRLSLILKIFISLGETFQLLLPG